MDATRTPATRLGWGGGDPIAGTPFRTIVTGEQTGGRLSIVAADMPVGEQVPAHIHSEEDQITVVISGTVGGTVGDQEVLLTAGSVCLMPRGVAHSHWNAGDDVARVLEIFTPSGMEKVFEQAGLLGSFSAPEGAPQPA
jgi:quercetin dioxygenase-like cupin family protein